MVIAVVAPQTLLLLAVGQRDLAVRAHKAMLALLADEERGIRPPVEEQNALELAIQRVLHRFRELRPDDVHFFFPVEAREVFDLDGGQVHRPGALLQLQHRERPGLRGGKGFDARGGTA